MPFLHFPCICWYKKLPLGEDSVQLSLHVKGDIFESKDQTVVSTNITIKLSSIVEPQSSKYDLFHRNTEVQNKRMISLFANMIAHQQEKKKKNNNNFFCVCVYSGWIYFC